jgi:hypothetical protein
MTEQEWLNEQRRSQMMMFALLRLGKVQRTKAGKRKLRLFACGCCRQVWEFLTDPSLREAVNVAEQFAEGQAGKVELQAAFRSAMRFTTGGYLPDAPGVRERTAAHMAASAATARAISAAFDMTALPLPLAGHHVENMEGDALLCHLLRCVFGNPFACVAVDPVWRRWHDRTIPHLAQAIYDERLLPSGHLDCTRLAVLADALEEAGCAEAAILDHLRGLGLHVRGCWVLDRLLEKE